MRLLSDVRIRNFRSVREANVELGAVSSFIGTNGSGKSNVLRALNLFFNGHVEGMEVLDIRRDFHKPWSSVSNRFIEVEVRFQLPADRKQFGIRKSLTTPLGVIGIAEGGDFWLRKRWTKDAVRENLVAVEVAHRPAAAADYTLLTGDGAVAAERFLQLTRFRYIPNHVPWDIRCLETLDPDVGGSGKNTLKNYLKANRGPLRARPRESPVVVLLDWEDSETDRQSFEELVTAHPTSTAIKWPEDAVNPSLADSFRGIERFLSTDLVRAAGLAHPGDGIVETVGVPGHYELQPARKATAKQRLVAQTRHRDDAGDLQRLIDQLNWLESHLPSATAPPLLGL